MRRLATEAGRRDGNLSSFDHHKYTLSSISHLILHLFKGVSSLHPAAYRMLLSYLCRFVLHTIPSYYRAIQNETSTTSKTNHSSWLSNILHGQRKVLTMVESIIQCMQELLNLTNGECRVQGHEICLAPCTTPGGTYSSLTLSSASPADHLSPRRAPGHKHRHTEMTSSDNER